MEDKVCACIAEILEEVVTPDTRQAECEAWDSLAHIRMIAALEELDISIPFEEVLEIQQVKDFFKFIK